MPARVAVIGGGIAGISCACELADAGLEVTLIEAKKQLGGRACSFADRRTGLMIDNCQHVLLGCCQAALEFFSRIGSLNRIEFSDRIRFVGDTGRELRIGSSRLPAPLHLAPSVAASSYLSWREKLRLARVMASLATRVPAKGASARDYLVDSLACPERLVLSLFDPILVSALNEGVGEASAKYARMVLTRSLLGASRDYRLGVPRAPLAEIVHAPAARYLAERGCRVRLGEKAAELELSGGQVQAIRLESGEGIETDFCAAAVPPRNLGEIGVDTPAKQLAWRPTVAVHMFLDTEPPDSGHACVTGEPFQWVFNKSADFGLDICYVQTVASAARELMGLAKGELVDAAMRAVARAMPEIAGARPVRAVVVREANATFATTGDSDRPAVTTSCPNLVLAGDWTDTQWPATMESAVRSGRVAARAILERA